jgi:hypothetical protein
MIAGPIRSDGDLLADVRARLDGDRPDGSASQCEVFVADGHATLVGHVRSRAVAQGLAAAAGEVSGVSRVHERLVADDELEYQVAAAVAAASPRASRLAVRADLGCVRIGGLYWSPQVRSDALRAAALVPGVLAARPVPASEIADRSVRVEEIWP